MKYCNLNKMIIPKYCQPNSIKRLFGIFSESHCIWCQYTRGLGCKLFINDDGRYEIKDGY